VVAAEFEQPDGDLSIHRAVFGHEDLQWPDVLTARVRIGSRRPEFLGSQHLADGCAQLVSADRRVDHAAPAPAVRQGHGGLAGE